MTADAFTLSAATMAAFTLSALLNSAACPTSLLAADSAWSSWLCDAPLVVRVSFYDVPMQQADAVRLCVRLCGTPVRYVFLRYACVVVCKCQASHTCVAHPCGAPARRACAACPCSGLVLYACALRLCSMLRAVCLCGTSAGCACAIPGVQYNPPPTHTHYSVILLRLLERLGARPSRKCCMRA
eukprot:364683-Chlamydomonas_euryale.AAC.3